MRIRGALAVVLAASAWAQSRTLTALEADLAKKVEQAAVADSASSDLVTKLTENRYAQGHLWKAWQTLRSAIARAENEGQRAVAFGLRMRLSDDLTEAGMFAEALAETKAAEAAADGKLPHRLNLMYRYTVCGACEEARRIRRSLPPPTEGATPSCGFVSGQAGILAGSHFKAPPGTKPEDELRLRVWFARNLHYRKEPDALRGHLEETVAFAERHALKSGASDLADVLVEFSGDDFETYSSRILQLAGPDPGVIERIAEAWLEHGDAARASSLFEQTWTIRLAKHGPWAWSLRRSLDGLERAAILARDWETAIGFSREAAHILEVSAGLQSRMLGEHLLTSAERFQTAGQADTSRDLWDRGLRIAEEAHGPLSRRFADALERAAKSTGRAEWAQRAKEIHARFPNPEACWRGPSKPNESGGESR